MRAYDWLMLALAVLAAIMLAAPGPWAAAAFVAGITVIGLPVAAAILVFPAVALVLAGGRLVQRGLIERLRPGARLGWIGGIGAVLAGLAAVQFDDRAAVTRAMEDLRAGDRDAVQGLLPRGGVYALIRAGSEAAACAELCQRLLLSGTAGAVVAVRAGTGLDFDPTAPGRLWRFAPGGTCPDAALPAQGPQDMRTSMLLRIARGDCLVAEEAPAGAADVVIAFTRQEAERRRRGLGYAPSIRTIATGRVSVHLRREAGFEELFRRSTATAQAILFPLPMVVPDMGGGSFSAEAGFPRETLRSGPPAPADLAAPVPGLDLALQPVDGAEDSPAEVLRARLADPAALTENDQRLVAVYLDGLKPLTGAAHRDLFLALISDPRVRIPGGASRHLPRDAGPAYEAAVARAAMARVWQPEAKLSGSGGVLLVLPDAALIPLRDDLFRLAQAPRERVRHWQALIRLGMFGEAGARQLLFLIDDAEKQPRRGNDWQHPHLSGLIGLCRMGRAAAPLAPEVEARAQAGIVSLGDGPYGRLGIHTLVSLGVPPERVAALAAGIARPMPADRIATVLAGAARKVECHF